MSNDKTVDRQEIDFPGLTPALAYQRIRNKESSFLLESVRSGGKTGHYSLLGRNPRLVFRSWNGWIELTYPDGRREKRTGKPIRILRDLFKEYGASRNISQETGFAGGAVGYFSYDAGRWFEELPDRHPNDLDIPDCCFMFIDLAVQFDHRSGTVQLISHGDRTDKELLSRSDSLLHDLKTPGTKTQTPTGKKPELSSNLSREGFEKMVEKAQEYIRAGDVFQVNLSQRYQAAFTGDSWSLYERLCRINPSPFACYLDMKDLVVVSCSPERLVRVQGNQVETRPIAGTRPRGEDRESDRNMSAELLLSEKERAEHIMLVDLERNDLGRICQYGSVEVNELMAVEDYSHVFHIVSNVRGELREGTDCFDVIRATFPGGTITGAPKIRCLEIIDELEPTRRGLYTGSIGYLSFSGEMDLNIVIRTFVIKDGQAYIQVGSGIVADSDPEKEYLETTYKAQALISALLGNTADARQNS
ncbi:MAG: aminodeoxychorismate synthase, component I [bacterium]